MALLDESALFAEAKNNGQPPDGLMLVSDYRPAISKVDLTQDSKIAPMIGEQKSKRKSYPPARMATTTPSPTASASHYAGAVSILKSTQWAVSIRFQPGFTAVWLPYWKVANVPTLSICEIRPPNVSGTLTRNANAAAKIGPDYLAQATILKATSLAVPARPPSAEAVSLKNEKISTSRVFHKQRTP
jgi:hypothetical protein